MGETHTSSWVSLVSGAVGRDISMRMSIFAESQIRVGGPENPSELITTRENLGEYFDLTKIPSFPARAVDGKN